MKGALYSIHFAKRHLGSGRDDFAAKALRWGHETLRAMGLSLQDARELRGAPSRPESGTVSHTPGDDATGG